MDEKKAELYETNIKSRKVKELTKCIHEKGDKDLLKILRGNFKNDRWNGNTSLIKYFKRDKKLRNIEGNIKNINDLTNEDRLILKARLIEIECTYERITIITLASAGLLAFLLFYKDLSKEILFKENPVAHYFYIGIVYIFIVLFLFYNSVKSKGLQAEAKYFLAIIDNIEKNLK